MSSHRGAGLPHVDAITANTLVIAGRVTRADVPGLCAELEAMLHSRQDAGPPPSVVHCDVGGVVQPDLTLVELIARLGLVVRRAGGTELRLRDVPPGLRALLDLVGLADVMGLGRDFLAPVPVSGPVPAPAPAPAPERDPV